ncbi:MAG TPA: hypothetical protein DCS67_00960 [Clostridiales bacterium UBA8960]|jgi:hypothetical protein|nr:hypothetical protein [Clostridiales bacterium UBA8960]
MVDNHTVMVDGFCAECGCREIDGHSCFGQFEFPLAWEHNDPALYALHFWLVTCYMIQHPSNYTEEGYAQMIRIFVDAYDNAWDTPHILKVNRERVKLIGKISNPTPSAHRSRKSRKWSMTINDIYLGGEENAIEGLLRWKDTIRRELPTFSEQD